MNARAITIQIAAVATLALGMLASAPARAQRAGDAGPELALRSGVMLPFGDVQGGGGNNNLDSYVGSAIPVVVEAGYRVDPTLFVGARFQYAFPQLKNPGGNCDNVSCDGSGVMLGLEGIYRFMPDAKLAPWVGLAAGYEWVTADYFTSAGGVGATNRGFQGLVQVGGDIRGGAQLVLGPFVEYAMGRYDSATGRFRVGNTTTESDSDISDTAWHGWLTLGVRGAFGF